MEPLFEVTTKYTYHEMKRYENYVLNHIAHYYLRMAAVILLFAAIGVALILFASGQIGAILLVGSVAGGILRLTIDAGRRSNQLMKNPLLDNLTTARFFEDHFTVDRDKNHTEFPYSQINRVCETDSNFYIMLTAAGGIIVTKKNCTPEVMEYIRGLAPAKKKR